MRSGEALLRKFEIPQRDRRSALFKHGKGNPETGFPLEVSLYSNSSYLMTRSPK